MQFDVNSEDQNSDPLSEATASTHSNVFFSFYRYQTEGRAKPGYFVTKRRSPPPTIKRISLLPRLLTFTYSSATLYNYLSFHTSNTASRTASQTM
jgi:hypothetical protein